MRLAIMQPYLFPYLNYFRLIATTDLFIIFDDVQFLRRSWINRNKLPTQQGHYEWLTLPIKYCTRDTLIKNIEFADNANNLWQKNLRKFPLFDDDRDEWTLFGTPCDFIVKNLRAICSVLSIPFNIMYASELDIPHEIKGENRILEICRLLKATEYLNASGGKDLYNKKEFDKRNIELEFLPDYANKKSMLERVCQENLKDLRDEIYI